MNPRVVGLLGTSDRLVSRLEIANAVRMLPYRQKRLIELHYADGLPLDAVCRRLRISESTFYREQRAALEAVVAVVFEEVTP